MQPTETMTEKFASGAGDRRRVEKMVETLAALHGEGESLAEVAHDARNMVTALWLYCDLLEEPGVLAVPFAHYGSELRLVAAASRRLVEKLMALDVYAAEGAECRQLMSTAGPEDQPPQGAPFEPLGAASARMVPGRPRHHRWDLLPALPIADLAAELQANRNLLAALVGPAIALTVDTEGGMQPVRLTGEDLTRVLVNLVKNAAEAMPAGGRIHLSLCDRPAVRGTTACVALAIEDSGPGIPEISLQAIFTPGFTTRDRGGAKKNNGSACHRGLGLSITRSIVEAAGGRITATNRERGGARLEIELPVRR